MAEKRPYSRYPLMDFRILTSPIIDVRSPIEFNQGHWPGAINIPLFSNKERELIGKSYKKEGQLKAIFNGLKVTVPNIQKLINLIIEITSQQDQSNKSLRIYCWRGGMRSKAVAWLARRNGIKTYLLKDGYKSYRKWVLSQFEADLPIRLLGGKTGTGKTEILKSMNSKAIFVIDLEGLANHRGSSFGSLGMEQQPTTQQFENIIAEQIDIYFKSSSLEIWLEAESSYLGKCRIPNNLYKKMKNAPILEIIKTEKERIDNLVNVYSQNPKNELKDAVNRISKRLGPIRTKDALTAIDKSEWPKACKAMLDYYDRCYDYELKKTTKLNSVNLSGLNLKLSLEKILNENLYTL